MGPVRTVNNVSGNFFDSWGTSFFKNNSEWIPGVSTVVGLANVIKAGSDSFMPKATKIGSIVHSIIAIVPGAGNLLCLIADLIVSASRHVFGSSNNTPVRKKIDLDSSTAKLAQELCPKDEVVVANNILANTKKAASLNRVCVYSVSAPSSLPDVSSGRSSEKIAKIIEIASDCQAWIGRDEDSPMLKGAVRAILGSDDENDVSSLRAVTRSHSEFRIYLSDDQQSCEIELETTKW